MPFGVPISLIHAYYIFLQLNTLIMFGGVHIMKILIMQFPHTPAILFDPNILNTLV